jgi:hypothetical protein
MLGLATEDEVLLDTQARAILMELTVPITSTEIITHFKTCNTSKQLAILQASVINIRKSVETLTKQRTLKFKDRKTTWSGSHNKKLNTFLGHVLGSSPLQNLLFVNEQLKCVSKTVPRVRERLDFVDSFGGKVGEGKFLLHTKGPSIIGGGRTEFDNPEACLSAMRACLERCVDWTEHVIVEDTRQRSFASTFSSTEAQDYGTVKLVNLLCTLRIPFQGTEYWVPSNCSSLRHILSDGNPPRIKVMSQAQTLALAQAQVQARTLSIAQARLQALQPRLMTDTDPVFLTLYPVYAEYLRLVKVQLKQLVRNNHSNDLCPITVIPCCRIAPACSGETFCNKVVQNGSKLVICVECKMDLCAGGCGRIYHGNTPCTSTLDEATDAFIHETSKPCPQCRFQITKDTGCNHMTCPCHCEFCWTCGIELPRDAYGHYSTTMHFSDRFGIGANNGCSQFN